MVRSIPAIAVVAALATGPAALAQTTAPLPPETPSHQTVPEANSSAAQPLSEKLDRSGGVIHPPAGVDPGLAQTPPPIGPQSTPVIPPVGSPGDQSGVKPK